MVESDRRDKQAAVSKIDSKYASPSERAAHIWNILRTEHPNLTNWDLICFSSEYLGTMSTMMEWLKKPVQELLRLVYTAHYYATQDVEPESTIGVFTPAGEQPVDSKAGSDSSGEREVNSNRVVQTRFWTGG